MEKRINATEEIIELSRKMRSMEYALRIAMAQTGASQADFWECVERTFPQLKGKVMNFNYLDNQISYQEKEEEDKTE